MVVACSVARNVARPPATTVAGLDDSAASLSLDFLSGVLDSRITYTNATANRTYYNSSGVLSYAAANTARFDYNPSTLAARGLLVEEARTNLILESQTLDVVPSGWGVSNATISANAATAPDGTSTADKIQEDTATTTHYASNATGSYTSGTTYTASAWLKAAERGFAFLVLGATGAFPVTAISINLTTGAVSTAVGTPLNAFTITCPSGWFRVGFSLAATSTAAGSIDIRTSTDGVWANRSYTGTLGSGIYAWGAQVEAGAFPTSYIATTSATVTRSADVADALTLTPWFNATQGTMFVEYEKAFDGVAGQGYASLNNNSANERIYITSGSSTQVQYLVTDGGVIQATVNVNRSAIGIFKSAGAYAVNSFQQATGGILGTEDTSGTLPTVDRLSIGVARSGVGSLNGWIRSVRYYPTRLPNSTLQAITA